MKRKQKKTKLAKSTERTPFDEKKHCVMTLRLNPELNDRLERYIFLNSDKQRQKKNIIVFALEQFLDANHS